MLPTTHTRVLEQAFEDAFDGQTINRRQWQVLESLARSPHASTRSAHDPLKMLEGFEDAQAAVHHLRDQRLLLDGSRWNADIDRRRRGRARECDGRRRNGSRRS